MWIKLNRKVWMYLMDNLLWQLEASFISVSPTICWWTDFRLLLRLNYVPQWIGMLYTFCYISLKTLQQMDPLIPLQSKNQLLHSALLSNAHMYPQPREFTSIPDFVIVKLVIWISKQTKASGQYHIIGFDDVYRFSHNSSFFLVKCKRDQCLTA